MLPDELQPCRSLTGRSCKKRWDKLQGRDKPLKLLIDLPTRRLRSLILFRR